MTALWGTLVNVATVLMGSAVGLLVNKGIPERINRALMVVAEMTCVGSLLIIALALNLLKVTTIKVANFLPSIFLPLLLCPLYTWIL